MERSKTKNLSRATWMLAWAVAVLGFSVPAPAQNIDDGLDQSYRHMYNLQFDEALRETAKLEALAKDDPLPWMAEGCAVLFREFERLHIMKSETFISDEKFASRRAQAWNAESKKQFDDALNNAEKLAHQRLSRNKDDARALFALTIVSGLRADDAALIAKKNLTALAYTKSANGYAERLLARSPNYYDAYVATGMGKYLIGGKAAPVRWVLRLGGLKGDQEEGVRELTLAAEHGRFLAPFARILLAFDDLRHKKDVEARKKLVALSEQFPNNAHFIEEMGKIDHHAPGGGQSTFP